MLSYREASSDSCSHLPQLSPAHSPPRASLYSSHCLGCSAHSCCLSVLWFYLQYFFSAFKPSSVHFLRPFLLLIRSALVSKYWDEWQCIHHLLGQAGPEAAGKVLLNWYIPFGVDVVRKFNSSGPCGVYWFIIWSS